MSALLVASAALSVLAVSGFAVRVCSPRLWARISDALCGPVEETHDGAAPNVRYARVWQHPDAAVDVPTWPLRRDEQGLFDELVYVHDFLSASRPLTTPEER